jgi:hypothetical protein
MFNGVYDREKRARRYRDIAAEYAGLSKDAADPFLRSCYLRVAEDYLVRAQASCAYLSERRSLRSPGPQTCQAPSHSPTLPSLEIE